MPRLTVNAEPHTFPDPLTVAELLARLGRDPRTLAVERNREVVPRADHAVTRLADGDAVEIVTLVGGGQDLDGPLTVGPFTFRSRLFTGTGKYATPELMRQCMAASGCEVTTVAVRRERLVGADGRSILDHLDLTKLTVLPNTAGCFSAEDAVRHARLARELLGNLGNPGAKWVKLECLADKKTLLPDPIDTLKSDGAVGRRRVLRAGVHVRRPGAGEATEGRRGGERDAGRQPHRVRARRAQPEQHPDSAGVPEGRRPDLPGHHRRRRGHGLATWRRRWNSAATACC